MKKNEGHQAAPYNSGQRFALILAYVLCVGQRIEMSVTLQIHRFPEDLKQKIDGFAPHDQRHGKLMTLVFRDGTKIRNAYVIDEEKTKDDYEELKDRFSELSDVTRQGWTMKEAEEEWWKD